MRRKFTCYRCGKCVEAEMDTDGDATCPACENVIGLEPERKLQNRIAELEADTTNLLAQLLIKALNEDILKLHIAELEAALRWIPVSERLPEERQNVLALDRTGTAYHWEYSRSLSNIFLGYYTHWMPLPKPPEVQ